MDEMERNAGQGCGSGVGEGAMETGWEDQEKLRGGGQIGSFLLS